MPARHESSKRSRHYETLMASPPLMRNQPFSAEYANRHLGFVRRNVRALPLRGLDGGEERLRVSLAHETALACGLAGGRAKARFPSLSCLRLVGIGAAHSVFPSSLSVRL